MRRHDDLLGLGDLFHDLPKLVYRSRVEVRLWLLNRKNDIIAEP